jgi:hypothetical protein
MRVGGAVVGGLFAALLPFSCALAWEAGLPLFFEPNRGQADTRVLFLARGDGFSLFLTAGRMVASGAGAAVGLRLAGANPRARVEGLEPLPGRSNYFLGSGGWRTGIPQYAQVRYRDLYPGVSLVFYGNRRQLEFDFRVAPGADPGAIRLEFDSTVTPQLSPEGWLTVGPLRLNRPAVYQGQRRLEGRYVLRGAGQVAFALPDYDRARPLNIDPVMTFASYLGGDGAVSGGSDYPRGVATDAAGNVYVAGTTESSKFPTTPNAAYSTYRGGQWTAFVAKFNPNGVPVYSTYFPGTDVVIESSAIAADAAGNAYVTGNTLSGSFPATDGAFQKTRAGGLDAFALKLGPNGSVVYATLLGGESSDYGQAIAVDNAGSVYVAGMTYSAKFPVTSGAYQTEKKTSTASFVSKLDAAGATLAYSTYFGAGAETVRAVALDSYRNLLVVGDTYSSAFPVTPDAFRSRRESTDGFLLKLNGAGSAVSYATFVGGSGYDSVRAVKIAADGSIFLAGVTGSQNLPVTPDASQPKLAGGYDAFLMKLNDTGAEVQHCTYLGGKANEDSVALGLDPSGNLLVAGETASNDFPVTDAALQPAFAGGSTDLFVTLFAQDGFARVVSSYYGGSAEEHLAGMALDSVGDLWLASYTLSGDLPVTGAAPRKTLASGGFDPYLAKLGSMTTVLNFATYYGGSGSSRTEQALGVAVDAGGNAYVTGQVFSTNFPATEGAFQVTPGGGTGGDAFVAKLDPSGTKLLFCTYLGGSGDDTGNAIAVDVSGFVHVVFDACAIRRLGLDRKFHLQQGTERNNGIGQLALPEVDDRACQPSGLDIPVEADTDCIFRPGLAERPEGALFPGFSAVRGFE